MRSTLTNNFDNNNDFTFGGNQDTEELMQIHEEEPIVIEEV